MTWLLLAIYAVGFVVASIVVGYIDADGDDEGFGFVAAMFWPISLAILVVIGGPLRAYEALTDLGGRWRK